VLLVIRARDEASQIVGQVEGSFGGLSSQVATLQAANKALGLEKEALNFSTLGTTLNATKQEYRSMGDQLNLLQAQRANGVTGLDAEIDALRLSSAEHRVLIGDMENELETKTRAIQSTQLANSQAQQEIELRQQASKQTMAQGAALAGLGVVSTVVGASILKMYVNAIGAAIDYEEQSRKTLTQVSGFKASLKDIEDVGLQVAKEIPVPMEQIQAGLFDIFSSIPVHNMTEAKDILTEMSKAAVAGSTDIQTVGRSSFEIMNAFGLSAKDVNHILDVQFKLVQLGIGDYQEINTNIGRLAPTAEIAGQSIDTMAGSLAFMTRITGDGSTAVTSIQRAMESMTNPKVQQGLKEIGVNVADANGQFRPFKDIVDDVSKALSGLDPQQRAAAIFDLFKSTGSGSLNTRKFFMAAIENTQEFDDILSQTADNAGEMQKAFEIMADSPAAKIQRLKNDFSAASITLGNELMPAAIEVIDKFTQLVEWFGKLDPRVKEAIIGFGLLAGGFLVIMGVVLLLAGAFLILDGAVGLLELELAPVIAAFALAFIGIIALVAIGYLLYRNWGSITDAAGVLWDKTVQAWNAIYKAVSEAVAWSWDELKKFWAWLSGEFVDIWSRIKQSAVDAWNGIKDAIGNAWDWIIGKVTGGNLEKLFESLVTNVSMVFKELGQTIVSIVGYLESFGSYVGGILSPILGLFVNTVQAIIGIITDFAGILLDILIPAITGFGTIFMDVMNILQATVVAVWGIIQGVFQIALSIITFLIQGAVAVIIAVWDAFSGELLAIIKLAWDLITALLTTALTFMSNFISFFMNLIQGDWSGAWGNIQAMFHAAWDAMWAILQFFWGLIKSFFTTLGPNILSAVGNLAGTLVSKGSDLINGLWNGAKAIFWSVIGWFDSVPGMIVGILGDLSSYLYGLGADLINGLWDGIKAIWDRLTSWIGDAASGIADTVSSVLHVLSPSRVMMDIGVNVGKGFEIGLKKSFRAATDSVQDLVNPLSTMTVDPPSVGAFGVSGNNVALNIASGAIVINVASGNPQDIADAVEDKLEDIMRELSIR
jgi:TP901 family phage tail tape measure protein